MRILLPFQSLKSFFDGAVIPVFNESILEEYHEVLHRPKFGFDPDTVDEFLREVTRRGVLLEPERTTIVLPDMNDVPFYAVTLAHGNDRTFLVTGNLKHFPVKPVIVPPAQFLEIIRLANSE